MAKGMRELLAEARARIEEIGTAEAERELRLGGGTLFLDVREPDEFAHGHLPGALLVPRGLLEPKAAADSPARDARLADRERPIIVYCASGARSALAARTLGELGFSKVRSLAGGLQAWAGEGRLTEA
jgi:rhodanese-related sulfurtransferase